MRKEWVLFLFLLAGRLLPGETDYLRMAVKAHQEGLYTLSNQVLEKFFQAADQPNADYANLLYAANLIKLKNWSEAGRRLDTLLERYPDSPYVRDALTYKTLLCLETNDLNLALATYQKFKGNFGSEKNLETQVFQKVLVRAVALLKSGQGSESKTLFQQILAQFPSSPGAGEAGYYLGLVFYQENQFLKAVEFLKEASEKVSDKELLADVYLKLGDCYLNLGMTDLAEGCYRKVAEDFPASVQKDWARLQTAHILKRKRAYPEAESLLSEILKSSPDPEIKSRALLEKGKLRMLQEDWSQAEKDFLELIKDYPGSGLVPETFLQLGLVSFNGRKLEKAITYFERFLSLCPDEEKKVPGYFGLGHTYYKKGQLRKAGQYWDRILQDFPESSFAPEVLFLLGKKYFESGDYKTSQGYLEKLVSQYPESNLSELACPALAESLVRQDKLPEARKTVEKFLTEKSPEELKLLYGRILFSLKDFAQARKVLESFSPGNLAYRAEALYYLGKIYQAAGETGKAQEKFLEIITFCPEVKEWVDKARQELKH